MIASGNATSPHGITAVQLNKNFPAALELPI
jgi:hypothetical protein